MITNCTRREALTRIAGLGAGGLGSSMVGPVRAGRSATGYAPVLSVQAYIWIQRFTTEKKSLAEGVEEMLSTFQRAGYRNVDLID